MTPKEKEAIRHQVLEEAARVADSWLETPSDDAYDAAKCIARDIRGLAAGHPASERGAPSEGLEMAAQWHESEAAHYESCNGDKDGVPFEIVAAWHRFFAARIRELHSE